MSTSTDYSLESRQRFMRQQLSALGYDQEFPKEVIPLLENLVTDLLQTTNTLQDYKNLSLNCLQACHDLENFLDAYKNDNAWLVQELNTLHLNTLAEKIDFEKLIAELTNHIMTSESAETVGVSVPKSRPISCARPSEPYISSSRVTVSKTADEVKNLKETIKNKDLEIKHLRSEILRLNNLLSCGRPLEAVLKEVSYSCECNRLKMQLNKAMVSDHEAKRIALKLAECSHHRNCDIIRDINFHHRGQHLNKPGVDVEKLKLLEEEIANLKDKYHIWENSANCNNRLSLEKQKLDSQQEISSLKDKCSNMDKERAKLQSELEELKASFDKMKSDYSKSEKELSKVKRSYEDVVIEKSNKEKQLLKQQDDKKHLLNRIQELTVIERDLTLEVTRLCNINAVYKRHILELENKFLEVSQNKGKALLATLKPGMFKKPLEKRPLRNTRDKENILSMERNDVEAERMSKILTGIRNKYKNEIDNMKTDISSRSFNVIEFESVIKNGNLRDRTFLDEIKNLNEKVDGLKNILSEKDELTSHIFSENKKLSIALAEKNAQAAAQKNNVHTCEHCRLAEKLTNEYKEKLITLEAEKRETLLKYIDCQKVVDCNKQHIMQLRSELHNTQMELQQCKADSSRFTRLEYETNFTVESSRAVQKQLEIQLESTKNHMKLLEKECNNMKSEILSLRDTNLKLQKSYNELETEKDELSSSSEQKSKKINTLDKLLKTKEHKISNLEQLVDGQQKLPNANTAKADSKKFLSSVDYLRGQIRSLDKSKEQALAENRRLQRQLSELTNDNISCKKELNKVKREAEDLKMQVHDYIAKVQAAEDTLQQKSTERIEMLDHFRTLTVEATQLESNKQSLESETRSTRNALKAAEAKIADLEHIIQNKDAVIAGYEEQLNELTKNVASLESQISNLTDQRNRLQAELDSCELLWSGFDNQREASSAMLSASNKMTDELHKLKTENQRLQISLSQEKLNVSTLENILSVTRNEHSEPNTLVAELQEEIRGLRANVKCLQDSLEITSKQLKISQNEAADFQKQVIQLNRELRNLQLECIKNTSDHSIK